MYFQALTTLPQYTPTTTLTTPLLAEYGYEAKRKYFKAHLY